MRIVNKQEFYNLQEGTLFANYQPIMFDDLCIKYQTIYDNQNNPIDFVYESLLGNLDCNSSDDYNNILIKCQEDKSSFKLDFDCGEREGLYDDESLYAIYEKSDIIDFIRKLNFCIDILK